MLTQNFRFIKDCDKEPPYLYEVGFHENYKIFYSNFNQRIVVILNTETNNYRVLENEKNTIPEFKDVINYIEAIKF